MHEAMAGTLPARACTGPPDPSERVLVPILATQAAAVARIMCRQRPTIRVEAITLFLTTGYSLPLEVHAASRPRARDSRIQQLADSVDMAYNCGCAPVPASRSRSSGPAKGSVLLS